MINLKKMYEEKKIVAFIGRAAAGKDTIVSTLINLINSNSNYRARKVVSYTTRPKRSNEVEGVDYYFITNEEFLKIKKSGSLYEETCYSVEKDRDWYYGLGDDCFIENNLNLVIVNPHGLRQLRDSQIGDRIVPVYVDCSESERIKRYLERDAFASKEALEKRIVQDNKDFEDIFELISEFPDYYRIISESIPVEDVINKNFNY